MPVYEMPRRRSRREGIMSEAVVTAECIGCKARRDIRAGEIPKEEVPMCQKCFNPMVAVKARLSRGSVR